MKLSSSQRWPWTPDPSVSTQILDYGFEPPHLTFEFKKKAFIEFFKTLEEPEKSMKVYSFKKNQDAFLFLYWNNGYRR